MYKLNKSRKKLLKSLNKISSLQRNICIVACQQQWGNVKDGKQLKNIPPRERYDMAKLKRENAMNDYLLVLDQCIKAQADIQYNKGDKVVCVAETLREYSREKLN